MYNRDYTPSLAGRQPTGYDEATMTTWVPALAVGVGVLVGTLVGAPADVAFPGVQPQLAASGAGVYLAFGEGDRMSVARSEDGGRTFGPPVRLPAAGTLSLGMHRGPRVAATSSTVLVSAVAGAKGGGADGDVLLFRSRDRGATWSAPLVVNDIPAAAREGLHAMAATPSGLVVIAWLDLAVKGTRVVAAVSHDHGATWAPDTVVYTSPAGAVCECCHPSVALDRNGDIAIMFRNNVDGNRDMYVVRSMGPSGFSPATRVDETSWRLNACPMDGGGLVLDGGAVSAAWRRDDGVFLRTDFGPERRIGAGRDPALARSGRHHDVAWTGAGGLMLARDAEAPLTIGPGRFPSLVAFPDRTLMAWEDQGRVVVRTIAR